jgi:hypothetical protein
MDRMTISGVTLLSITAASLLAAPQQAAAQYTNTYTFRQWNNPISNYLDVRIQQRMQQRRLEERIRARSGRSGETGGAAAGAAPSTTPPAAPRHPIAATDFRASGTRLLPDTLAAATPGTAEEKGQLRTLYRQVLDGFEEQARKNNVAYALTFLIGVSMQVVNGRELSETETELLARELNDVLASAPEFRRSTARQKQTMYEAAVITAGMIGLMHQIGVDQANDELKEQAKELAESVIGQLLGGRTP